MSDETVTPLPDTKQSEWLVTNGLGGYASGTINGVLTRRYHGLLVAALPNPLGRMMMLNGVAREAAGARTGSVLHGHCRTDRDQHGTNAATA